MTQFTSIVNRVLFVLAFVLAAVAIGERLVNQFGYTVLRGAFAPYRLLELAGIALLFVIALELREIHHALAPKGTP
jgi:hypothetical protein